MLPTFVVIGAQKCGTTALYENLRSHPQIFLPDLKETNFFIEPNWRLGVKWYESHFAAAGAAAHAGDVSPAYSLFPDYPGAPARMASLIPNAKLVYLVRDPIARMRAHYALALTLGVDHRPIGDALLHGYHFLAPSQYSLQLEQFLEHFDRSSILILRTEDLRAQPRETLDQLLVFLGLEPGWTPSDLGVTYNATRDRRVLRSRMHRAIDTLHALGAARMANRVAGIAAQQRWCSRLVTDADLELQPDDFDALRRCVAPDMARFRSLVGPDFDLWGYA